VETVQGITIDLSKGIITRKGRPSIVLVEFGEFQCPFCGQFARESHQRIVREFVDTGLIAYAYFSFPLERIHPLAFHAAESAECAARQGKYGEMRDVLFRHQQKLVRSDLREYARQIGLDEPEFANCLDGRATLRVREQMEAGQRAGVKSTPTFFVARTTEGTDSAFAFTRLIGAKTYDVMAGEIRKVLAGQ
jgi:protein-disulfide isomerase